METPQEILDSESVVATGGNGNGVGPSLPTAASVGQAYTPSAGPTQTPVPKKRGRHPNSCQCPRCQQRRAGTLPASGNVSMATEGETGPSASVPPPIDPEVIREGIRAVCISIDETITSAVRGKAIAVTTDKAYADQLAEKVRQKESNRELIANLGTKLCEKYNVAGQYAPEIFFAFGMVAWLGPVVVVVRELKTLEAEKASDA